MIQRHILRHARGTNVHHHDTTNGANYRCGAVAKRVPMQFNAHRRFAITHRMVTQHHDRHFSKNDKTKIVRIGGKIVRIGGECVMFLFFWCWAGGRVATQHHDRHELAMSLGPRNHTQHIVCTRVWCRAPATPDPRTLNPPPQRKHAEQIPDNRLDMPPKPQSSVGTLYETAKRARTCAQTLRNQERVSKTTIVMSCH